MDLLENLNKEQLSAVTHTQGPLLIVAGAGTGKTTVITRRIGYLIQQEFARPDQILALTFTEKAAGEMVDRTENLLPLGTLDLWISTFHSFAERILKQHALDIGLSNDFKLLDDIGQWILVHRNFDRFKLKYYRPLGNPNKFIDALLSHFSKCKDEMITPEDYLAYAEKLKLNRDSAEGVAIQDEQADSEEIDRIEELAGAYHTYQKLLLDNNYLDFGDLIHYVTVLFKKRPKILQYYQNHFKYILVDEFQDTNYAQYELIKMLAGNKERNLTVVGDDDQSIYKFRGASVSNILKLKTDFPDFTQIALIQNYRSAQNILDLAYDFIQANNPSRLEVELGINKRLVTDGKSAGTIHVLEAVDLSGELDLVIKKIAELKTGNAELSWNDFCILIRSNSASGELLPKLEAAGIPFYYFANQGLFKKRLIFDLINYLKLLDNYHESVSLFRVMEFPKFAVHPEDIATIKSFIDRKTLSLYEALSNAEMRTKISEDARAKLDDLISSLHKHGKEAKEKTAVEVFVNVVKDLGIDVWLAPETLENAQQRELLEQFYKKIEQYEQENEDKSLSGFLYVLGLEQEAGSEGDIKFDPNIGPELVKVMTIHASKGLEFQYVFIINMVDQRFPTRGKRDAIEIPEPLIKDILPEGDFHLQEERRLFYVALTRAKKGVFLSWAKDYGGSREKKPSIFLQETKLISIPEGKKSAGKIVLQRPDLSARTAKFQDLPTHFSYSEINCFQKCPLEYKYRYYLRLPLRGGPYLSFGSSVHKALQLFMEQWQRSQNSAQQDLFGGESKIDLPTLAQLEKWYQESWIDDWYHSKKEKEEYKAKGYVMLKTFYEETLKKNPKPKFIEKFFKLTLGQSRYEFVGKIDRADVTPEGLAIIDYKTGKSTGTHDVDQLRIYQWACQDYFQEKVANMCYWYLEANECVESPLASHEEIDELKNDLLKTIEEIREAVKFDTFADLNEKAKQHDCLFDGYR